jgi:hypothetical protein
LRSLLDIILEKWALRCHVEHICWIGMAKQGDKLPYAYPSIDFKLSTIQPTQDFKMTCELAEDDASILTKPMQSSFS